ncbi:MAG: hypothetical protein Q9159_004239 [Coniocarpon cinnabarinum]
MRFLELAVLCLLPARVVSKSGTKAAADDSDKSLWKPCTAESHTSGNFFDINPLQVHPPETDEDGKPKKGSKDKEIHSWHARGYDYHSNFTLNFCGPVVEPLDDIRGLPKRMWRNVSGFYEKNGETYAIGLESQEPVIRGRKLVLNYTHGSLCPSIGDRDDKVRRWQAPTDSNRSDSEDHEFTDFWAKKGDDDDDDNDDGDRLRKGKNNGRDTERRKSTIISLLCEREPKDGDPPVTVSFVGSIDDCTYFFEARSKSACATTKVNTQPLGPGSVFGIIAIITVLVYLVGGIMYQRIVQHQRGWRQLPNYALWSSIFGFMSDMTIIVFSTIGRCIPGFDRMFGGRKSGYSRVNHYEDGGYANGTPTRASRRGGGEDDENRLIDQLDEQWDD